MTEATLCQTEETTRPTVREYVRSQRWVWLAGCLLLTLLAREVIEMAQVWIESADSSHGFLVIPGFAYLVWRKRARLASDLVQPFAPAGLLALLSIAVFLVGKQSGLSSMYRSAVVFSTWSYVVWVFGTSVGRRLAGPLLFLLLLVPPPLVLVSNVSLPLRKLATEASCSIASLLGVALTTYGTTIHLPEGTIEIEAACSGLRGIITLGLIAIFLGELREAPVLNRLFLLAAAPLLAVLLNAVRVLLTILLAASLGLGAVSSSLHEALGLAVIAVGAAGLAALPAGSLRRKEARS